MTIDECEVSVQEYLQRIYDKLDKTDKMRFLLYNLPDLETPLLEDELEERNLIAKSDKK